MLNHTVTFKVAEKQTLFFIASYLQGHFNNLVVISRKLIIVKYNISAIFHEHILSYLIARCTQRILINCSYHTGFDPEL